MVTRRLTLPDPERCGKCHGTGRVTNTRKGKGYRRRRHRCNDCGHRWSSFQSLIHPKHVTFKVK